MEPAVRAPRPVRIRRQSPPIDAHDLLRYRSGALVFGLYLVGGFVAMWHVWAHPTKQQLGSGTGDLAQADWFLRWTPWAIAHLQNPFVSQVINVPFGVNLVNNSTMFALGLIAAPATAIWGSVTSVNLLFTLAFPVSAGAAYLLGRRFTTWRPAAFVGGLLYGFSPYMVAEGLGHLNLIFVPVPPLIMLVLHELFVRQEHSAVRWGGLLGGLVVLQFFISSEILAATALFAIIATALAAVAGRAVLRAKVRHAATAIAVAVVVSAAALSFPLYELLTGPQRITGTITGFRYYYSALFAPLLPPSGMVFATAHLKAMAGLIGGNTSENGTYLGLPLVVLVLVAVLVVRRASVRIAAVMAMVAFVLSLGDRFHFGIVRLAKVGNNTPLPAALLRRTPLLNDALPVRYALFVALFVSVVVAVTLEALRRHSIASSAKHPSRQMGRPLRTGRRLRTGLWGSAGAPALLSLVVLLPLLPAWPYPDVGPTNVPTFFTTSAVDRIAAGTVVLVYPLADSANASAELWQADADMRFKMVGGYFVLPAGSTSQYFAPTLTQGVLSDLLVGVAPVRSADLRQRLRAQLGGWGVRSIVAQPVGTDPIGFFTWLTGRAPDATTGGMAEWYATTWR